MILTPQDILDAGRLVATQQARGGLGPIDAAALKFEILTTAVQYGFATLTPSEERLQPALPATLARVTLERA
jgi:hypothetical protein